MSDNKLSNYQSTVLIGPPDVRFNNIKVNKPIHSRQNYMEFDGMKPNSFQETNTGGINNPQYIMHNHKNTSNSSHEHINEKKVKSATDPLLYFKKLIQEDSLFPPCNTRFGAGRGFSTNAVHKKAWPSLHNEQDVSNENVPLGISSGPPEHLFQTRSALSNRIENISDVSIFRPIQFKRKTLNNVKKSKVNDVSPNASDNKENKEENNIFKRQQDTNFDKNSFRNITMQRNYANSINGNSDLIKSNEGSDSPKIETTNHKEFINLNKSSNKKNEVNMQDINSDRAISTIIHQIDNSYKTNLDRLENVDNIINHSSVAKKQEEDNANEDEIVSAINITEQIHTTNAKDDCKNSVHFEGSNVCEESCHTVNLEDEHSNKDAIENNEIEEAEIEKDNTVIIEQHDEQQISNKEIDQSLENKNISLCDEQFTMTDISKDSFILLEVPNSLAMKVELTNNSDISLDTSCIASNLPVVPKCLKNCDTNKSDKENNIPVKSKKKKKKTYKNKCDTKINYGSINTAVAASEEV